ncbi:hypothetical protein GCM10010156_49430 [Planobispora rosea]|uniref:Uncharacterized protein n=1 Tax=Planobispora rosea TaxID=35762 RepID=A0A8J3S7M6_PLARO|nr:DUF6349 family protein [Planobispora rosea]GGS84928.1 hypothetical protein GCM10010156_49430 [Planobispora rosea]GIH86454.1 hypothetical protein Pro02_48620 [Planobispora rosea]
MAPDLPVPIAPTHPGPGEPGSPCRVTVCSWWAEDGEVASPTVADPSYHLRFRSHCGGCGHEGPARSCENAAVEDGCDHAYPGWRRLPVMEHRPYEGAPLKRWEAECRRVYPPGWFDQQGPVRAYRTPPGMRHVPGYAPGGGYSIAVLVPRLPFTRAAFAAATVQDALFP